MLWDFASSRYAHNSKHGAAFPVKYMEDLWGNRRTRNHVVREYFTSIQGDNISHQFSAFTPYDFLGRVLVEYLEDPLPIDLMDGEKRLGLPPRAILSRAAKNDLDVKHAKHSAWKGVSPSPTIPINQHALLEFSRTTTDQRERLSALRLLRLSRNSLCPGMIPVLYQQKSTGRLTEVLFSIQNTEREVISAALHGMWDYDLQNAHFSIFSEWAKKLLKLTPVVDEYLLNKSQIRNELANHCHANVDDIKECLIALLYGAQLNANPQFNTIPRILGKESAELFILHPFVRSLKHEITRIGKYIVEDLPRHRGSYGNAMKIFVPEPDKKKFTFILLCHALQGVEALSLRTIVARYGEDILLCMHDGWVSRTRLDCNELRDLIEKTTNFDLGIEEKQLPKYPPSTEGIQNWYFADSTPVKPGGMYLSSAPNWAVRANVRGRDTRPDLTARAAYRRIGVSLIKNV